MTLQTTIRYLLAGSLLLLLGLTAYSCTVGATPVSPTNTPVAGPTSNFTPVATVTSTVQVRNTLAISEPLPSTFIGEKVTIKGEGMAFENTIVVEVISGQGLLGRGIVTTEAQPGQVGHFITTISVAPVAEDTAGLVTIYTTSPVDGTVDQRASVPVTIRASEQPETPGTRTVPVAKPNIRINPTRGRPGTEITVVGGNFPPNTEVQIRLSSLNLGAAPEIYATTEAGQHGNIQASFVMPDRWPSGELIDIPEVLVLASTPDFVVKATAQFALESPATPSVLATVTPTDQ